MHTIAPPNKRGRHKGLNTREKREQLGRPLPLEWDVRGRTYKEIGEYSSNFSRELGLLVRQYTDPDCTQWSKVPNASKERILAHLEVSSLCIFMLILILCYISYLLINVCKLG